MRVILISGKSHSGKDQFAKYLYDELDENDYRVLIIHFADFVKYCCKQYYGWDGNKDAVGRTILQRIGTDVVRRVYPNFWGELVAKFIHATQYDWDYVLIPDWRFINEYKNICKYNNDVITVRINRLNPDGTYLLNPSMTEKQNRHPSECELDDYNFDWIINNSRDLNNLQMAANDFLEEIVHDDGFFFTGTNEILEHDRDNASAG